MKESAWRSKLVKLFNITHSEGFIWAMDAKFKAGFPDLYVLINGTMGGHSLPFHYELKVVDNFREASLDVMDYLEPVQISVCKSIAKAGGKSRALVLSLQKKDVYLYDFSTHSTMLFSNDLFTTFWVGRHSLD